MSKVVSFIKRNAVGILALAFAFELALAIPAAQALVTINNISDLNNNVLCPLTKLIFSILMIVGVVMALWAGFQYVTSSGDPGKVSSAGKTLVFAAIGLAVGILAFAFPTIVSSLLGGGTTAACSGSANLPSGPNNNNLYNLGSPITIPNSNPNSNSTYDPYDPNNY